MDFDSNHFDLHQSSGDAGQIKQIETINEKDQKEEKEDEDEDDEEKERQIAKTFISVAEIVHHNNSIVKGELVTTYPNGTTVHLTCNKNRLRTYSHSVERSGESSTESSSELCNSVPLSSFDVAAQRYSCLCKSGGDSIEYTEGSVDDITIPIKDGDKNEDEKSGEESKGRFWFSKFKKRHLLTLASLCLVDFTSSMGMSIMAPFFPLEASNKGLDEATIGFVFSSYALVMFLTSPIFGRLIRHVGAHFLFFSGLFLAAGCTLLFGILDKLDGQMFTVFCFLVHSMEALGAAAYNTAACTIVAELFPDNVSAVFGLLETFVGLGMTMGPAVGGALYSISGFGLPFYSLGAFMAIMIPINMWLLPSQQTSTESIKSGTILDLLRQPSVLVTASVTIVEATAWSFLDPFLQPHLTAELGLSSGYVGLVFLMLSATYGIFCPIFGWMADRWSRTTIMMVLGMIFTSFSLLLIGPSNLLPFLPQHTLWLNLLSLVIMGMATPLAEIPTFERMMDNAIDDCGMEDNIGTYGLVSGIWSAAFALGEFLGPSVGGVLMKKWDFYTSSTVIAGLVIIPVFFLFIFEIVHCSIKKHEVLSAPVVQVKEKVLKFSNEKTPLLKTL